jgi:hypothetical protein
MKRIAFLSILFAALIEFAIERQVRPVDCGGSCDRDTTVECRGTSALLSYGFAEARQKSVCFQGIVAYVHESEHQIVAHRIGSCFRWSVWGKVV